MSQIPPFKQRFRGMNQDSDVRSLKDGEYRKLTNGSPVQPKSSTVAIGDNVSSIYGNALVSYSLPTGPSGTNKVVGFVEDRKSNRAFYAMACAGPTGSPNANDSIFQYKDGAISLVFRSSLLGFSADDFVDMDITGDNLIFTNNRSEIKKLNVASALAGGIYTPALEEITLIKRAPQRILTLTPQATARSVNNIKFHSFQFMYRYIYSDNEYSVFGATSEVICKDISGSAYDAIDVVVTETPPATVRKVEFAVRIDGSPEAIIYRSESNPPDGSHRFYNDANLETVADAVSLKWNDDVPRLTKSLKIMKNRLFLFGNTEGYDLTGAPITNATLSIVTSTTDHVFKDDGSYGAGMAYFDRFGRIIGVRKVGDIAIPLRNSGGVTPTSYQVRLTLSSMVAADIPIDAYSWAPVRTKNRRCSWFLQGVSADLFLRSIKSDGTSVYGKGGPDFTASAPGDILIDLKSFSAINIGYTWNAGDRIKLWIGIQFWDLEITGQEGRFIVAPAQGTILALPGNDNIVTIEIYTPIQNPIETYYECGGYYPIQNAGQSGRSFYVSTLDLLGDTYMVKRHVTEVGATEKYYGYVVGGSYSVSAPFGNTFALHSPGGALSEPINLFWSMAKGSYLPYTNPNWNIWIDQTGREIGYDHDGSYQRTKVSIRFSNPYNFESKVLGLNTFDALDDQLLPVENGECTRLAAAGEVLVGVHSVEATAIYVDQGYVQTADGNSFLARTEGVIGDFAKYGGGHGSVHPQTVVSRNDVVYWLDFRRGAVIRRSQNGLVPISELYGLKGVISQLCIAHKALGTDSRIIAGWDPQYESYCISFIKISDNSGYTFYFHEKTNAWIFQAQILPEFWGLLEMNQLAFKAGALWAQTIESNYNNFFGVQYNRTTEIEIAPLGSLEKIWEAMEVDVESIYSTGGSNEDIVLLYHTNGGTVQNKINYLDFKQRGSAWWSSFFRNLNDASMGSTTESKYKSRHNTRGQSAYITIVYNGTDKNPMKSISIFFRPSMNTSP